MKKKLTLAFLYNIRRHYPDLNDPKTQLEVDFDDPESIAMVVKYLKNCGYQVIPIEANEQAYFNLFKNREKIDLAYNIAEGMHGRDRESHIPAMLEMLQIPYTGSSPLSQGLILDKAKAKEIFLANDIPTLPYQLFKTNKDKLNHKLQFPLIVKPVAEGSSAGVTNDSVVYNTNDLEKQVIFIHTTFKEPALIEPYLSGREFSVAMIGNPPKILPIIESDHSVLPKDYASLDSLEVKWFFEKESEVNNLICPAKINNLLREKLEAICLEAWRVLGVLDWCRVDIRCDEKENPYILEVNSPPGMTPPEISTTSYFPLAARIAGIEYEELLKMIIESACKRYKINF